MKSLPYDPGAPGCDRIGPGVRPAGRAWSPHPAQRVTAFGHRVMGASVRLRQLHFLRSMPRRCEERRHFHREEQRTNDGRIYAFDEQISSCHRACNEVSLWSL
jgi:hypothetical protein